MSKMDDILRLDRDDTSISGAIADFALLPGGRVAWRLWPNDLDTPYVAGLLFSAGHPFVISEDPADLPRLIEERGL